MGIFIREHERGNEPHWGRISAAAGAGLLSLATVWSSLYVVEQKEVALEVLFGGVTEVNKEPGLYAKTPFFSSAIKYPLYRQQTTVTAQDANLRTKDQMRVEGGLYVDYEIDEKSETIERIYADLRGDKEDIDNIINIRAKEAAVIAFGEFSSVELTSKINEITDRTKVLLQKSIDEQGWPFTIKSVISNGVRLSPDSEKKLERVMDQEQERIVLDLRERNADKAKIVLEKEGAALGALYQEMAKAGVPTSSAASIICLKMANDAGKIQEAFAPGCFPNSGGTGVVVPFPQAQAREPAPAVK